MEFQYKLMRATVASIGGRAVRNIQNDSARGVRNLLDFGMHFAKSPAQKIFYGTVRNMVDSPGSRYGALIRDAANHIESRVLLTACVNFGYNALTYGAKKLREHEKVMGRVLPWNLVYDLMEFTAEDTPSVCALLDRLTGEGRELGIYTYLIRPDLKGRCFPVVMDLALKYSDCIFLIGVEPEAIRETVLESLREVPNVIPFIHVNPVRPERAEAAFARMFERGRLFGYLAVYGGRRGDAAMAMPFIERMARAHCLMGVYIGPDSLRSDSRANVRRLRTNRNVPLLCLDFYRDISTMAKTLRSAPVMVCFNVRGGMALKPTARSPWKKSSLAAEDGSLSELLSAAVTAAARR